MGYVVNLPAWAAEAGRSWSQRRRVGPSITNSTEERSQWRGPSKVWISAVSAGSEMGRVERVRLLEASLESAASTHSSHRFIGLIARRHGAALIEVFMGGAGWIWRAGLAQIQRG